MLGAPEGFSGLGVGCRLKETPSSRCCLSEPAVKTEGGTVAGRAQGSDEEVTGGSMLWRALCQRRLQKQPGTAHAALPTHSGSLPGCRAWPPSCPFDCGSCAQGLGQETVCENGRNTAALIPAVWAYRLQSRGVQNRHHPLLESSGMTKVVVYRWGELH